MLVGCSADGIPEETDGNRPGGLTCIRFGLEGAYGQVVATDGEQVIRLEVAQIPVRILCRTSRFCNLTSIRV